MKIVFLASDLAMPGQGAQLTHLACATKEAGHEVTVLAFGQSLGQAEAALKEKGIASKTFPSQSWRLPLALLKFAFATLGNRPDILQTWGFKANIIGKTLGFFCGAKAIVSSLRSPESPKRMEIERVSSFLCAKAVANSSWLANLAQTCGISKDLLTVIPNACDTASVKHKERKRPASKDGKWKLLFLGVRSLDSGLPVMITALGALNKSGMPFKAVLAGEAEKQFDAELAMHLQDSGLNSKIEIRPQVTQEAVQKLMEESHLLIVPNVFDWTPNTILEAFASGLPVVAANIEGVKELVIDGKTGHMAMPMDPTSLAKKIAESLMDYEATLRMAREALKHARERYNPQSVHSSYLELYKSLDKTAEQGAKPS